MYLQIETINNKAYRFKMSDITDHYIDMKPYRYIIKFTDGTSVLFNMRYILSIEYTEE